MNTANRVLWLLVGLLLLSVGLLGALASTGRLPFVDSSGPLVTQSMVRRWHAAGVLAVAVAAVGGLVVAVLGAWLLRRQFPSRPARLPDPVLTEPGVPTGNGEHGPLRVRVTSAVLSRAFSRDLRRDRRIRRADVRLGGRPRRPTLHLGLVISSAADLTEVTESITRSLRRWHTTTGLEARLSDVTVSSQDDRPA